MLFFSTARKITMRWTSQSFDLMHYMTCMRNKIKNQTLLILSVESSKREDVKRRGEQTKTKNMHFILFEWKTVMDSQKIGRKSNLHAWACRLNKNSRQSNWGPVSSRRYGAPPARCPGWSGPVLPAVNFPAARREDTRDTHPGLSCWHREATRARQSPWTVAGWWEFGPRARCRRRMGGCWGKCPETRRRLWRAPTGPPSRPDRVHRPHFGRAHPAAVQSTSASGTCGFHPMDCSGASRSGQKHYNLVLLQ